VLPAGGLTSTMTTPRQSLSRLKSRSPAPGTGSRDCRNRPRGCWNLGAAFFSGGVFPVAAQGGSAVHLD